VTRRPLGLLFASVFAILLLLFLYSIAQILLLLFIAILFSLYLGAITDPLQRYTGMPRPLGVAIAVLVTLLAAVGVGWLIVPPLAAQTMELLHALPRLMERWEAELLAFARQSPVAAQMLGPPPEEGSTYVGRIVQQVAGFFQGLLPYVFSGLQFLIHVFSVLVMGVYLTLRPGLYKEGFILLAPPVHRELVRDVLGELARTLRAWIAGQLVAMIFLGTLTWIGLVLLGVPYALAFGVFTAAVSIVPFFGTLVSTLLPALYVLGTIGPMKALLVVGLGVVIQLVESNIVSPMIMERQVRLPPVLTLLSVLVMAHLLELIGLFVAVPVLAALMVIVRRLYVHRMLEGKGFRRAIRDQPIELRLPADGVLVHPGARNTSVPSVLEE
jgi:predicted PurR-regulated permease PerM